MRSCHVEEEEEVNYKSDIVWMLCECAQDIVSGVRLCGSSMMFVAGVIVRLVE